jgi:hypothetical protein
MIERPHSLSARIHEYEMSLPAHRAGTVDTAVLVALERLAPSTINWSMETGCGKTTVLLSNLSARHHVFAYDDRDESQSSVNYYEQCPLFRPDRTATIFGATQLTLPAFEFAEPIDLALLDGPHAYPFPELEYYHIYPHLRRGALLVVDDIHIPTIHRLHTFLADDEMFTLVHVERTTSFFVRTDAVAFYPLGDGWEFQRFNKTRFPAYPPPVPAPPPADGVNMRVTAVEARLAATERELAWWKEAAEARRLKRRLARVVGDWPLLR